MSVDWFRRSVTVLTVAPTTIYALSTEAGSMALLHVLHLVGLIEFTRAVSSLFKNKSGYLVISCGVFSSLSTFWGLYSFGLVMSLSVGSVLFCHLSQLFNFSYLEPPSNKVIDMANNFKFAIIDVLCLLWVTNGFSHLMLLRLTAAHGFGHCIFLILCVWNVDNGALFAGSSCRNLFKTPKNDIIGETFLPKRALLSMEYLSPSKSWTGVTGGLALGCLTAIGLVYCMTHRNGVEESLQTDPFSSSSSENMFANSATSSCYLFHPSASIPCWRPMVWYMLGMGVTGLAVVGDLFESSLKRYVGIKDSGNFFPGHGGCLDRMDSVMIAGIWYFYSVKLLEEWHT